MQFKLSFSCDNAVFADFFTGEVSHETLETKQEIARILREVASRIESGEYFDKYRNITDVNGNIIGTYALKDK